MWGAALLLFGSLVLLALAIDAGWTTLWADRSGGPLSSRITASAWRYGSRALAGHHTAMSLLGPIAVALVLLLWVALLWLGWFLVFSVDGASVVNADSGDPATGFDRFYFVGYTIFTLGNGDFAPNGAPWQLATVLATASGLILVTVAITYLISVLSAVVTKRTFAARVHAMGATPQAFVTNSWDGDGFRGLDLVLTSLVDDLARLATQHLAYPVIHFYHPGRRDASTAVAVALLDEVVTLLESGVDRPFRPSRAVLRSVRGSIEGYLEALSGGTVRWAQSEPALPSLDDLRAVGIPTVDQSAYEATTAVAGERRQRIVGLVESDGWTWE